MMLVLDSINLVLCIFIFQIGICWCQPSLKYSVNEEINIGFVVGNINDHVMSNFHEYQSYEVSVKDKYFTVTKKKDLIVTKRIDLETLCSEANFCCGSSQCVIVVGVLINSLNVPTNRFNIEIEVLDINDNIPFFNNPQQTLSIQENNKIGAIIPIDGGKDDDMSQANQIQIYKFVELSKTFVLDSNDMSSLSLVLQKQIDYERQKVYYAKLEACDNSTRCVPQSIIINVQDENDNLPIFEKTRYEVEIQESYEIGKVIISARAVDLDGPLFNKTKYDFYDNRDNLLTLNFKINERTGDIILKSKLSAKQRLLYVFKVYAMDMSGKKNIADVTIKVKDINDNAPIIELYQSKRIINDKETFEMIIEENERAQKLMSIRVSDADVGLNAKVVCELKDRSSLLELKYLDSGVYEINSVRSFDYEQETQIKAIFECKDSGVPVLSSYKSIKINIEDVNEFPPEFDQAEYHTSIKENTDPGETVITVHSTDKDGAAVLRYSIEQSATPYFSINPTSGVIKTASISLDRELIAFKSFRITVTDAVLNPLSAYANVQINIKDENDNDPIFVSSSLQFFVLENEPLRTRLDGQLTATDNDKDKSNSFITFTLIDTFDMDLRKCNEPHFLVKANGDLETLSSLDRESNATFTLTVEARDQGSPPRFTRANATVIVNDVNDNSPQWIYPRPHEARRNSVSSLPEVNLTENIERFHLIMKLKAHDPDWNEAGRVSYLLVNHRESLFTVNETNGELRTDRSPLPYGSHKLHLRATDHGTPARTSDSSLLINISDSGRLTNINLTIIVGMVGITALISIFLIIAIICVRRRPPFHQSYLAPSTDVSKDQTSNQYFSHNQWMFHPSDDTAMPPLSDNESCIYLPSNYYGQQDPLIIESLTTGSRPASRLDYPLVLPSSHYVNNSDMKFGSQSSHNGERSNGTLRSNNGIYCSINAPVSGIIINGQELDGDSADSGKGASEVDLRLQYHLNNVNRSYTTMPFPHHSGTTSTFGYQNNLTGPQYFPSNSNSKSFDSRFLTVHPSNFQGRRVISPTFNSSNQCQCFILPEDDVIQVSHGSDQIPMTTFSPQSMFNLKSANHEHNCAYHDDIVMQTGTGYYTPCPYAQETASRLSQSPILTNKIDNMESYEDAYDTKQRNNHYLSTDSANQESNIYKLGFAN